MSPLRTPSSAGPLALEGGDPVRAEPWPPRHLFGEAEKQAVVDLFDQCMETGQAFGYSGPEEQALTASFAQGLGGGYADGVNSGTNAMYVALRSLDLEPRGEVILPPITDPGGAMPVALLGCVPVVADGVDGSYNVGAAQIEARLTERTAAIVVTHVAGIPADLDPILELARSRHLPVVEDCAQAHGALYQGRPVGTFGEVAAFSTMSGKHMATGGQGGLVFTTSEDRYWKVRRAADRGKPLGLEKAEGNVEASLNCNMDELHAAIGRVQLEKLPSVVAERRRLALILEAGCRERVASVRMRGDPAHGRASFWFLFFHLDLDQLAVDKEHFVQALAAEGIPADPSYGFSPAWSPWFRDRAAFAHSTFPWAEDSPTDPASLPNIAATNAAHFRVLFHEALTEREIEDILTALEKVERACLAGSG